MRPIAHVAHETMFDRIEMDIIDVLGKVAFVANGVLPETLLPKRQISTRPSPLLDPGINQRATKMSFYPSPASREIRIVWRQ